MTDVYAHTVETFVFSGGGVRAGPLFAGALSNLVKQVPDLDYTSRRCALKRVRGTSMGAVIGLFVAMRVSPEDICAFIMRVPSDSFVQWDLSNLITHYGFNKGDGVEALLSSMTHTFARHANPTFQELHAITGIALEVIATDVDQRTSVMFSPHVTPDEYVIQAVLASTAIPFFFAPRRLQTPLDDAPHYCVDGAVTLNYSQEGLDPTKAMGFHIITSAGASQPEERLPDTGMYRNLMQYISQFIMLLISFGEPREYFIPTVRVVLPDRRINVLSLDASARAQLISLGNHCTTRFLATHTIVGKTRDVGTQT